MYTLTEIGHDNVTSNDYLGYGFSFVSKEAATDYFLKSYDAWLGKPDARNCVDLEESTLQNINDNIFAFVISEGGREIFPLYKNLHYYIVTENGKTFKNLTFK